MVQMLAKKTNKKKPSTIEIAEGKWIQRIPILDFIEV